MTALEQIKQLALNLTTEEKQALARYLVEAKSPQTAVAARRTLP